MDSKKLEQQIRETMQRQGLTITEVANRMGKAKQTISTTLSSGNPTISTLSDMARAIGVPLRDLLPQDGNDAELSALVYCEGEYYRASTLEEYEEVGKKLREKLKGEPAQ